MWRGQRRGGRHKLSMYMREVTVLWKRGLLGRLDGKADSSVGYKEGWSC